MPSGLQQSLLYTLSPVSSGFTQGTISRGCFGMLASCLERRHHCGEVSRVSFPAHFFSAGLLAKSLCSPYSPDVFWSGGWRGKGQHSSSISSKSPFSCSSLCHQSQRYVLRTQGESSHGDGVWDACLRLTEGEVSPGLSYCLQLTRSLLLVFYK